MIRVKKNRGTLKIFSLCLFTEAFLLNCSVEKQPPVPFEGQASTEDADGQELNGKSHRSASDDLESKGHKNPAEKAKDGGDGAQKQNLPGELPQADMPTPTPPTAGEPSSPPKDPGGNPANQGDPILQLHQNKPTECAGCHEKKRLNATHYPKSDCVLCHKYPSFKGGFFAHDPKPETCESCHPRPQTTGLRSYPNQGPPANFDPNDPAALGAGHYRGKDCVQCHQTQKEGATAFLFSHSAPNPGVCLPCHYNQGFREHRNSQNISLTGFGNCNSCHIHFDAKVQRDFRPGN